MAMTMPTMTMADVTVAIAASLAGGGVCVAAGLLHTPPAPAPAPAHALVPVPAAATADRAPSLEPKQLLAWQALFDMMKMKRTTTPSSSSTAGHVDTAAGGGGCEGTCTSRDDPCSCSDLTYVRCSDDGTALIYLDIGECHVTGKQQHTKVATLKHTRNDAERKIETKQMSVCTVRVPAVDY